MEDTDWSLILITDHYLPKVMALTILIIFLIIIIVIVIIIRSSSSIALPN